MKHYQALPSRKARYFIDRNIWGEWVHVPHGEYTPIIWITYKGELIK